MYCCTPFMSKIVVRVFRQPWAALPWQAPRAAASCGKLPCTAQGAALAGLECPHNLRVSSPACKRLLYCATGVCHTPQCQVVWFDVVCYVQAMSKPPSGGFVEARTPAHARLACPQHCSMSSELVHMMDPMAGCAVRASACWAHTQQLTASCLRLSMLTAPLPQDIQCIHCLGQAAVHPQRE